METTSRFTLRQLPLPAKLVVSTFLLAIGLGYTAAMVQLHMQDSKSGKPLPTVEDVILKYTGKRWCTKDDVPRPICRIEQVITGDPTGDLLGKNMAPAFFAKDGGEYEKLLKADPEWKPQLDAQRQGEQTAIALWAQADAKTRENAYKTDRFLPPAEKAPNSITPTYRHPDGAIKVKSILDERCARCHYPGGSKSEPRLDNFDEIVKLLTVPAGTVVPESGGYVSIQKPMDIKVLTQTTHTHLLSFAMLFSLTGLVFAFTSYPTIVRCVVGPIVVIALVADISLWWLARLNEPYGPYFAMCIIGTGGLAGLGLAAQITLSLFNMYAWKGKMALLGLFAVAGGLGGWVAVTVVKPGLDAKQDPVVTEEPQTKPKQEIVPFAPSPLEKVLTGTYREKGPWGTGTGGMIRAFFDKDELDYIPSLKPQREGEHAAVFAWIKAEPAVREKAYHTDRFTLPAELVGKPITPQWLSDPSTVKVKSILNERCAVCHGLGKEKEEIPLENYEQIAKYLAAPDAVKKVDAAPGQPTPEPKTVVLPGPPKPAPIPMVEPKDVATGPSMLEQLVTGPQKKGSLNAKPGGMVGAFFDKEDEYKDAVKSKSPDLPKLTAERENEQAAMLAWIQSAPDARQKAYETDAFPLPASLIGKPLTPAFKADDKTVKVKSLFVARCVFCHGEGGEKADAPLEKYDEILEFLKPTKK